jgi:orotidine-5'-phosphate decarboxylase
MRETRQALCIALDGSDRRWILDTARAVAPYAGWLKLGLEAFVAHGPRLVEDIAGAGAKVFLDLKLHDIPATVERAAANCAACGAAMLTVHAGGGRRMLEAAAAGARAGAGDAPTVVAVTVLTSLDRSALEELGIGCDPLDLVLRWAALAREAGLGGVVASAREAAAVRRSCGDDFVIVTPGIRPASAVKDDQRRTLGPAEALVAGADLLVVGRPVTRSPDPAAAAREILREMSSRSAPDQS